MLFDLEPKTKEKDFFNYNEELNSLIGYIKDKTSRMVLIRGLRRTGKSSLLRVALKKAGLRYVLIDARELTSLSRRTFEAKLFEKLRLAEGVPANLLNRIESVEAGIKISLKNEHGIWEILKTTNPIIAVDEAQMLNGTGVDAFFAAAYDNTRCKIILTGSEIGVLDSFVGKENPKAPLFVRIYKEIRTRTLEAEKSAEFLRMGFKEVGKQVSDAEITNAVQQLDGILGWLTVFGNIASSSDAKTALRKAVGDGARLAYSEFETFLGSRQSAKKRYTSLLRIVAEKKEVGWAELKNALQIELKESISDPQFSNYLNALVDYGFVLHVEGGYSIPDPLLKKAFIGNGMVNDSGLKP